MLIMRLNKYDSSNKLVINLVGLPGVGKTTLINNFKNFFNKINLSNTVGFIDYMTDGDDQVLTLTDYEMRNRVFSLPDIIDKMDESIILVETPPLSGLLFSAIEDNLDESESDYIDLSIANAKTVGRLINLGLQPDSLSRMNDRITKRSETREREAFPIDKYETLYHHYYSTIVPKCDYLINNGSTQDVLDDFYSLLLSIEDKPVWTFIVGKSGSGKSTFIDKWTKRKVSNINIKFTDSTVLNHNEILKSFLQIKGNLTFDRCPFIEDLVYNSIDLEHEYKEGQYLNRNTIRSINELLFEIREYVDLVFILVGDSHDHRVVLDNLGLNYELSDDLLKKNTHKYYSSEILVTDSNPELDDDDK